MPSERSDVRSKAAEVRKHALEVAAEVTPFEHAVLLRARALNALQQSWKRRVSRHQMSRKSYIESLLQAESRFMEAVAALRQKEGVDGHEHE